MHLPTKPSFAPFLLTAIFPLLFCIVHIPAQEKQKKPDTQKDTIPANQVAQNKLDPEIGILVEYIMLDHLTANKLLREFAPKAADAQELRDILGKMLDKKEAELIETAWVRGQSDRRSVSMSVREDIYPTEYDPAEIPNVVGNFTDPDTDNKSAPDSNDKDVRSLAKKTVAIYPEIYMTSANPTAFETRHVGITLEVDPIISQDRKSIHIALSPEIVTRLAERYFTRKGYENTARGIEHISMPTFYTMKTTTQILVTPGKYNLLGFHTPSGDSDKRIFVLLRADLMSLE